MNTIFTILLLAVIGVALGLVLAALAKRGAAPRDTARPDEAARRRLTQLKEQLDSGLISKEEYQRERETLLRK